MWFLLLTSDLPTEEDAVECPSDALLVSSTEEKTIIIRNSLKQPLKFNDREEELV